jgi:cytochrome b6-f complex iron-sulfur subunit
VAARRVIMGRYNFSPDEIERRSKLSAELKKKSLTQRSAAEGAAGEKGKKSAKEDKKAAVAAPKIDWVAVKKKKADRRNFLHGTAQFTAAMGITALGSNRFMFPRILFEPPTVFDAGRIDAYLVGQPIFFKEFRTWIVRTADRIYALSGRCTHLGCTPAWLASDRKFKCPCHGSGFRPSGINFEGPAPRALERFQIKLEGGHLIVDKAKMFLLEKGDWEKPDSFVLV